MFLCREDCSHECGIIVIPHAPPAYKSVEAMSLCGYRLNDIWNSCPTIRPKNMVYQENSCKAAISGYVPSSTRTLHTYRSFSELFSCQVTIIITDTNCERNKFCVCLCSHGTKASTTITNNCLGIYFCCQVTAYSCMNYSHTKYLHNNFVDNGNAMALRMKLCASLISDMMCNRTS